MRRLIDQAMERLNWLFDSIYADGGRRSIPPERLQLLYSIRSERQLVEKISYNLPYRWFVGLSIDDPEMAHQGACWELIGSSHHDISERWSALSGFGIH
jgi:transposase